MSTKSHQEIKIPNNQVRRKTDTHAIKGRSEIGSPAKTKPEPSVYGIPKIQGFPERQDPRTRQQTPEEMTISHGECIPNVVVGQLNAGGNFFAEDLRRWLPVNRLHDRPKVEIKLSDPSLASATKRYVLKVPSRIRTRQRILVRMGMKTRQLIHLD